jgi:hypothetical protein
MDDALERIAAIASSLKEAELRTLLELTRRADGRNQVRYSSRKIAEAAGLSRKNVQLALDSLTNRGLISSDGGSATRASTYQLAYTTTAVLPGPGVIATPPHPQQEALFRRHPGAEKTPPPGVIATPPINRECTGGKPAEISAASTGVLDAILRANPKKIDPELLARARDRLYGYMRKFGRSLEPHPPDQQIVAQFAAIAPWPQLDGVLEELWRRRQPAGDSYAWFLGVALQRIHGLRFEDVRRRRQDLRATDPQAITRQFDAAPRRKGWR